MAPVSEKKRIRGWWKHHRGKQIVYFSILSRFVIFLIAQISNLFVEDYDSSFDTLLLDQDKFTTLQHVVSTILKVFTRWDSFYFLHIAQNGYVYEQENAFFPMYPLLINFLAITGTHSIFFFFSNNYTLNPLDLHFFPFLVVLFPLRALIGEQLVYMLSGIIVSNLSFVGSAVALYRLGLVLFGNEPFAYLSTILYCICPAGIFMSAMYIFFGRLFHVCILALISVSGLVIFQVQGYHGFCISIQPRPGDSPWCYDQFPLIYNYVQDHYWGVGFLRYYTLKQLPNFVFALPMVILCSVGIFTYAQFDWKRFLSIGISQYLECDTPISKSISTPSLSPEDKDTLFKSEKTTNPIENIQELPDRSNLMKSQPDIETRLGLYLLPRISTKDIVSLPSNSCFTSTEILPYIYLWIFLLFVSVTTMHIQVITRFMSSMPTIYWYMAHVFLDTDRPPVFDTPESPRFSGLPKYMLYYVINYAGIGVVLFSNFFPPA
ncbi:GPI mannosyltransferase 2 [Smittium mucronatum]|uniref:GPI mannosyltransferase 2 n=1 Tax=Smittium mucronatum TaxID=133383 RepID=A0A1R0GU11_9FUNG|nr:GPI mannosyltransferase 2 [Smittium mucronatum]